MEEHTVEARGVSSSKLLGSTYMNPTAKVIYYVRPNSLCFITTMEDIGKLKRHSPITSQDKRWFFEQKSVLSCQNRRVKIEVPPQTFYKGYAVLYFEVWDNDVGELYQ